MADLEARIQALEDLEAIKRLKYRYWRCLDLKLWDELAGCFTDDATVDYGGGQYRFRGRTAIMDFLRRSLGVETGARGCHHGHHPEIELSGPTTAHGSWALYNYLFKESRGIRIAAYYHDDYVKVDGAWKIKHTGYTPLFHEEWDRNDTPSLRVT
jgi:hypothetical protein